MRYRARVIEFPVGFPVDSLMSFPVDSLMSFPVDSLMNFPGSEGIVEDVKNGFFNPDFTSFLCGEARLGRIGEISQLKWAEVFRNWMRRSCIILGDYALIFNVICIFKNPLLF